MPNTWYISGTDTGSDLISSILGGIGHIATIFGQLLFVGFWLTLIALILGAVFLIWLNLRHARECDIQDSQETRAEDLLRELAPPDQRFSIVDGRAVKYRGQIPNLEAQPVSLETDDDPSAAPPNSDNLSFDEPPEAAQAKTNQQEAQVDERLKFAPPVGASPERPSAENRVEKEAKG